MEEVFDYDVFLSFASSDEEFARPIWQELCLSGLRVFWSDASLKQRLGEAWYESIQSSLVRSRHLIVIASPASMSSKWVNLEYQAFHTHCFRAGLRRLIPVLAGGFKASQLPLFLQQLEAVSLDNSNAVRTIARLLGGTDVEELKRTVLAREEEIQRLAHTTTNYESEIAALRQELSTAKQQQVALAARVANTKNPAEPVAIATVAPLAATSAQSDAVVVPESNPKVRQAVEAALKEAKQDGQNVPFVASKLFGTQGVGATGEICLLLSEGKQEYWAAVNCIRFLKFSLSQSGVRQFDRLVLQTLSAALAATGDIRNTAVEVFKNWPVHPKEKWACLMEWLWAASNPGGAVLVNTLVDITPADRRAETGAAINNLMFTGDESLIQSCIAGIQRLNYRTAASTLRELVETTLSANVAINASTVLANWRDTASGPAIRNAMDQVQLNYPTFGGLAKALRTLEGDGCSSFVADHFMGLNTGDQAPLLEYSWLDEFSNDAFISQIVNLERTTANLKVKSAAQKFLSRIRPGSASASG